MKARFKEILVLCTLLVVHLNYAQDKTITGTVSDQNGFPLPGVNIIVEGTTTGTQTDFDGVYSIVASEGQTLLFSYIGQKEASIVVGASSTVDVIMEEDAQALDEVVVTGQGIKREKKALGYAQQSVEGENIVQARETDVANALAGRISGVQITSNTSSSFGSSSIKLRGNENLLYVVDGVRIYSSDDVNMDNVANISVLKGASATAVYGPEGANGVVIITSKSGTEGVATFEVNQSVSITSITTLPEYQNEYGGGYSQTFNTFNYDPTLDPASWASFDGQQYPDFWADESWGPKLSGQMVRHWDSWIPNTDEFGELRAWEPTPNDVDSFYRDAITTNTTLGFSKGGDQYSVRGTVNYVSQDGVLPNSNSQTLKVSLNTSYNVTKKLKFIANLNIEDRDRLNTPDSGSGGVGYNFNAWWQRQLDVDRLKDYFRDGQAVSWNIRGPRDSRPLYWDSPYFHSYENQLNEYKNSYFGNLGIVYDFNDHLNVSFDMRKTFHSYMYDDRSTTISLLDPADYTENFNNNERTDFFGMLNYQNRFFNNDLDVALSLGVERVDKSYRALYATANGDLTIPDFYNLAGSQDPVTAINTAIYSKTDGTFVKGSIGYKNTLYLDGSYRLDWSSTAQAEANRLETYGGSASFLVNNILPQNDVLTFFKLRAGYASAPFFPDPYKTQSVYEVESLYQGYGRLGVNATQANPLLEGGIRDEFEAGAELQFFRNRLSFDVTYFNRADKNLPIEVPLDGATGYSNITVNSGKQTSKGIELGVSGDLFRTDDFQWTLGVNFATLERRVDALYEGIEARELSTYTSNLRLLERVGEEWGLFYGTGFATDDNGNVIFTESGGDYYYAIQQNKALGSLLPDFTGGVTTNVNYKNFNLALAFDFQSGGQYYSRTERYLDHSGLSAKTAGLNDNGVDLRSSVESGGGVHIQGVLQTGTDESGNPISDGTVVDTYVDAQDYFNSGYLGSIYENNVHDASYVKLRTVKLGYNFDKKLMNTLNMSSASISVYANNLWLIYSDMPWIDPSELNTRNDINWAEAGQLPMSKTIGLNLKLTF